VRARQATDASAHNTDTNPSRCHRKCLRGISNDAADKQSILALIATAWLPICAMAPAPRTCRFARNLIGPMIERPLVVIGHWAFVSVGRHTVFFELILWSASLRRSRTAMCRSRTAI
jgi:hypothetical protein